LCGFATYEFATFLGYPLSAISVLLLVGYLICFSSSCCSSKTLINALAMVVSTDLVLKLAVVIAIYLLVHRVLQKDYGALWLILAAVFCCLLNVAFFYFL
ncbi:hypothetical protein OESDEN_02754, partial [Oesophagostomum dentatum]